MGSSEKVTDRGFQELPVSQRDFLIPLTSLCGNDPDIHLSKYAEFSERQTVFVGTSFLRSLLLCLQLTTKGKAAPKATRNPQLVIVDRNDFVIGCWKILQQHPKKILAGDFSEIQSLMEKFLREHIIANDALLPFSPEELMGEVSSQMTKICSHISSYDPVLVESILSRAIILCSDWADEHNFQLLTDKFPKTGYDFVLYPSNIVECEFENEEKQVLVLRNIEVMCPRVVVHTVANYSQEDLIKDANYRVPSEVLFVEGAVPCHQVLDHVHMFSITRTHGGKKKLPKKMEGADHVLKLVQVAPVSQENRLLVESGFFGDSSAAAGSAKTQETKVAVIAQNGERQCP